MISTATVFLLLVLAINLSNGGHTWQHAIAGASLAAAVYIIRGWTHP